MLDRPIGRWEHGALQRLGRKVAAGLRARSDIHGLFPLRADPVVGVGVGSHRLALGAPISD